jgi:hypothetical protein
MVRRRRNAMRDAAKKRWSDGGLSILLYGSMLLILTLPFLTLYDVRRKGYDFRGHDPESWFVFVHAGYALFAIGALVGVVAAVRGRVASDGLSSEKRVMVNALVGALFLAYASPLIFFLVKVDGYVWVVARSMWDFISDAL